MWTAFYMPIHDDNRYGQMDKSPEEYALESVQTAQKFYMRVDEHRSEMIAHALSMGCSPSAIRAALREVAESPLKF